MESVRATYHDHALSADTTGFILKAGDVKEGLHGYVENVVVCSRTRGTLAWLKEWLRKRFPGGIAGSGCWPID